MGDVGGGGAAGGSGEQGEVAHAGALADGSIGEAHPEDLDPAVGARPRVVPVVAAVRAPPRHPRGRQRSRRRRSCYLAGPRTPEEEMEMRGGERWAGRGSEVW